MSFEARSEELTQNFASLGFDLNAPAVGKRLRNAVIFPVGKEGQADE